MYLETGYILYYSKRVIRFNVFTIYKISKHLRVYYNNDTYGIVVNDKLIFESLYSHFSSYKRNFNDAVFECGIFSGDERIKMTDEDEIVLMNNDKILYPEIFCDAYFITPYKTICELMVISPYKYNYGRILYIDDLYVGIPNKYVDNTINNRLWIWISQI